MSKIERVRKLFKNDFVRIGFGNDNDMFLKEFLEKHKEIFYTDITVRFFETNATLPSKAKMNELEIIGSIYGDFSVSFNEDYPATFFIDLNEVELLGVKNDKILTKIKNDLLKYEILNGYQIDFFKWNGETDGGNITILIVKLGIELVHAFGIRDLLNIYITLKNPDFLKNFSETDLEMVFDNIEDIELSIYSPTSTTGYKFLDFTITDYKKIEKKFIKCLKLFSNELNQKTKNTLFGMYGKEYPELFV